MKIELCCRRKSSGKTTNNLWELCTTPLYDINAPKSNMIHFDSIGMSVRCTLEVKTLMEIEKIKRKPNMSLYFKL